MDISDELYKKYIESMTEVVEHTFTYDGDVNTKTYTFTAPRFLGLIHPCIYYDPMSELSTFYIIHKNIIEEWFKTHTDVDIFHYFFYIGDIEKNISIIGNNYSILEICEYAYKNKWYKPERQTLIFGYINNAKKSHDNFMAENASLFYAYDI